MGIMENAIDGVRALPDPFDEIVRKYGPLVARCAQRVLGRCVDVDDVVQETWCTYLRCGHQIVDRQATGGWLARVATNLALNAAVAGVRLAPVPDDSLEHHLAAIEFDVVADVHRSELHAALRSAVADLPEADRRLLELFIDPADLDYHRISALSGRPRGALGPHRGRLIRKLRCDPTLRRLADMNEGASPVAGAAA